MPDTPHTRTSLTRVARTCPIAALLLCSLLFFAISGRGATEPEPDSTPIAAAIHFITTASNFFVFAQEIA